MILIWSKNEYRAIVAELFANFQQPTLYRRRKSWPGNHLQLFFRKPQYLSYYKSFSGLSAALSTFNAFCRVFFGLKNFEKWTNFYCKAISVEINASKHRWDQPTSAKQVQCIPFAPTVDLAGSLMWRFVRLGQWWPLAIEANKSEFSMWGDWMKVKVPRNIYEFSFRTTLVLRSCHNKAFSLGWRSKEMQRSSSINYQTFGCRWKSQRSSTIHKHKMSLFSQLERPAGGSRPFNSPETS